MIKWTALSKSEKVMIGFIFILVLAIAFRWKPIYEELKKGIEPYINEQPATNYK